MGCDEKFGVKKLASAAIIMVVFWMIAVVLWQTTGDIFYLFNFVYLGMAIGVGIGLYMALPRRQKHWGRRVSQFLMGGCLLVFLGLLRWENMQIEGFFARNGQRVLSTECILCLECVNVCSKGALGTTFALDVANQELLREGEPFGGKRERDMGR